MTIPVFGESYGKTRNAEIRSAFPIGEKIMVVPMFDSELIRLFAANVNGYAGAA